MTALDMALALLMGGMAVFGFMRGFVQEVLSLLAWGVAMTVVGAILCQLRFKEKTDLDLLYAVIAPALPSKEFFLRKAIGWALRQYAWTDPAEVRRYVRARALPVRSLGEAPGQYVMQR